METREQRIRKLLQLTSEVAYDLLNPNWHTKRDIIIEKIRFVRAAVDDMEKEDSDGCSQLNSALSSLTL